MPDILPDLFKNYTVTQSLLGKWENDPDERIRALVHLARELRKRPQVVIITHQLPTGLTMESLRGYAVDVTANAAIYQISYLKLKEEEMKLDPDTLPENQPTPAKPTTVDPKPIELKPLYEAVVTADFLNMRELGTNTAAGRVVKGEHLVVWDETMVEVGGQMQKRAVITHPKQSPRYHVWAEYLERVSE
jgi:hypothetical protein